ncbi:MAG: HlyD family type I secretion periplasmic adaptor subunit [Sphingomonadales bacterium]
MSAGKQLVAAPLSSVGNWARKAFLPPREPAGLRYLARPVLLEETRPPYSLSAVIALTAALVIGFIIWAAVVTLDETAVAPGEILPINHVQPVEHLEGGIVAAILVGNGDKVEAGQPLLMLDDTQSMADLDRVRARHAALRYQIDRLRAFALEQPMPPAPELDHASLHQDQAAIFAAQVEGRRAQLGVMDNQIDDRRKEIAGLRDQQAMLERQVALVREELSIREELLQKGLTSKIVYLATEREMNRTQGELADVKSRIARAQIALSEAQGRFLETENRLRNEALDELGRASAELAQVSEEMRRLEDRVRRLVVAAPVAGTVNGLMVKSVGSVLAPGDQVAEIVPQQSELVAQIRISPRDIGYVRSGANALVKVDTYEFGRYGGIEGEITHVSAASYLDEQGQPYFRGRVKLARDFVGAQGLGNLVSPGMTLIADIKTGEKSLLGYLVRPVERALSGAFNER